MPALPRGYYIFRFAIGVALHLHPTRAPSCSGSFLVLRPGLLQWYREDPNQDGEFLGTLRLTSATTVELEAHKGGERRLKVHAAGETLVLRDDSDSMVPVTEWEQSLVSHIFKLRDAGGGDAADAGATPPALSARQSSRRGGAGGGAAEQPMDVS